MMLKLVLMLIGLALAEADLIKAYSDVEYQANGAQYLLWSVEVYTNAIGGHRHVCGGSLVTPSVVISAARCFWEKGEQLPASRFDVARTFGGLIGTLWQAVQKSKVLAIHLPSSFRGRAGLFVNDIAVLALTKPLGGVTPICVNFDHDLEMKQLSEGSFGRNIGTLQTAGYAFPSPLHTALEVPYVSRERCANGSEPYYREQLTEDKICTGFKPDALDRRESLICQGDHGSGLAFYSGTGLSAIPYLRGVASTPFRDPDENGSYSSCSTFRYAAFTRVSSHRAFLEQLIPGIEAKCAQYYTTNADDNFECNCHCNNYNKTVT